MIIDEVRKISCNNCKFKKDKKTSKICYDCKNLYPKNKKFTNWKLRIENNNNKL